MQVHNRDLANSLKIDLDQDEQQAEPISFDALVACSDGNGCSLPDA